MAPITVHINDELALQDIITDKTNAVDRIRKLYEDGNAYLNTKSVKDFARDIPRVRVDHSIRCRRGAPGYSF